MKSYRKVWGIHCRQSTHNENKARKNSRLSGTAEHSLAVSFARNKSQMQINWSKQDMIMCLLQFVSICDLLHAKEAAKGCFAVPANIDWA